MIGSSPLAGTPIAAAATPSAAAAEASTDRSLVAPFQTRTTRSRRALSQGWIGALAVQQQAAVVPASAWMARPVERRRTTARELVAVEPLQWQYIAPTVAAILPRPTVIKVEFRRKLQETEPVPYSQPSTGPPSTDSALAAGFITRRIRSRRLLSPAELIGVGAASAPVIPYLEPAAALKRRETTRKRQAVTHCPSYPPTPAVAVPYLEAAQATRRTETRRTLRTAAHAPSYPPTPAPATIAAVLPAKAKRRKHRQGLFLSSGGDVLSIPPAATPTAAVYPSFVPTGYHRRTETERRLQRVIDAPVYPATEVTPSSSATIAETFQTRVQRSRRRLTVQDLPFVQPAIIETTPATLAAFTPVKAKRRKSRQGLFLSSGSADGFQAASTAQPESAWRAQKAHRIEFRRRLQREPVQIERPQTPPVAPQPEQAWRLQKKYRAPMQRRKLLPAAPQLSFPETPPVIELTGSEWIIRARRKGRRA